MAPMIDFAHLDLRGAFDLAIMIEEDAQIRYEEFSRMFADEPGGAAQVFREMAGNEAKHRTELEARRRLMFKKDPPRIEISVMDEGVERAELPDDVERVTAREALQMALEAEERAYAFYRDAIPHVKDPSVRQFFEDLAGEEIEHQRLLRAKLDALR